MVDGRAVTTLGIVRGVPADRDLLLFAGIPYASPPVGELRFAPPQPAVPWTGTRKADTFPPAPPQQPLRGCPSGREAGSGQLVVTDENCLYLNVWTPSTVGARPVLVWLAGDGFERGSASPPVTDGGALARLTGTVVVTVNHRLGALGYLHLADVGGAGWKRSSNLALQDQLFALRWVRENIGAFGADPANVTVAGSSAAASCIAALLAMPDAAGSFDKAILHSAAPQRMVPADLATVMTDHLLTDLGVDDLEELAGLPAQRIVDAQDMVVDADIGQQHLPGGRAWGLVLDGDVVPRPPQVAVAAGAARRIPLLIGANRDEFCLIRVNQLDTFAPRGIEAVRQEMRRAGVVDVDQVIAAYRARLPGLDQHSLAALRSAFLGDAVHRVPATALAAAQASTGGTAYTYLFTGEPLGPALGAFHGCELLYLFGRLGANGSDTQENLATRHALGSAWGRFAATGDPGWPAYRPGRSRSTRRIGPAVAMVAEPRVDAAGDVLLALARAGERP
jgi:para-nitrobenzyl esterase